MIEDGISVLYNDATLLIFCTPIILANTTAAVTHNNNIKYLINLKKYLDFNRF